MTWGMHVIDSPCQTPTRIKTEEKGMLHRRLFLFVNDGMVPIDLGVFRMPQDGNAQTLIISTPAERESASEKTALEFIDLIQTTLSDIGVDFTPYTRRTADGDKVDQIRIRLKTK